MKLFRSTKRISTDTNPFIVGAPPRYTAPCSVPVVLILANLIAFGLAIDLVVGSSATSLFAILGCILYASVLVWIIFRWRA